MSAQSSRLTILDGGMGTTLEDSGHDVSSKLWSADPKLQRAVGEVHQGFLQAGARLIGTATYQACESLYVESGCTVEQAHQLMRQGVEIGHRASDGSAKLGLCLGPFGGTLSPGQEYGGFYPPPFGPRAFVEGGDNVNTFDTANQDSEAIEALRDFHLARLRVFAVDEDTWRKIDWICFETVPVAREITAIRLAMRDLFAQAAPKPFWISCVFPEGRYPDGTSVSDIVARLLSDSTPRPDAIGVNCTSPAYIDDLAKQMGDVVVDLALPARPAFVLYPDGGLVYDPPTRTWHVPSPDLVGLKGPGSWAHHVAAVTNKAVDARIPTGEPVWSHVYVGGCCKAGFDEIRDLNSTLRG